MSLPDTFVTLAEAGYRYVGRGRCKGCGLTVEWFYTRKNRLMPFSVKTGKVTQYEPHWASCSAAAQFRRKKREA
jgi:hypothetical protein